MVNLMHLVKSCSYDSSHPVICGYLRLMGRRDDVISAATALLREQGPDALTSGNVAERLGVTQSAIYRHIVDMDELTRIASHTLVAELATVMVAAVASPDTTWGDGTHIIRFAGRLVDLMEQHGQAFATIDRWRDDDGELGEGLRNLLVFGRDLIAIELEKEWRDDFDYHDAFDNDVLAASRLHASLIIDDVIAVARWVRTSSNQLDVIRLLSMRLFGGWCGYVLDVNRRLGLDTPVLGGPKMLAPTFPTS